MNFPEELHQQGMEEEVGDRIGLSVRLNAHDSAPYPDGYFKTDGTGSLQDRMRCTGQGRIYASLPEVCIGREQLK